jgi:hypothetical protein
LSDEANKVNDELIYSSDIQEVRKLISEAPSEIKSNWETFNKYLEQKSPKTYNNIKKLGKFVEFLFTR